MKNNVQKNNKKIPGIVYLGRFQLIYYLPDNSRIVAFNFPANIVNDLEVIKKDELVTIIKDFITKNQLDPRPYLVLLADEIVFAKTFISPDQKIKEEEISTFIDTVPFEETSVVKVPSETKTVVAVVNKDYFLSFKQAFYNSGFSLDIVLPAFLLTKYVDLKKSQDANSFALVLRHFNEFRSYNLNQDDSVINLIDKPLISNEVPKDKKRLYVLAGVFGLLILVLIAVYYFSTQTSQENIPNTNQGIQSTLTPSVAVPVNQENQVKTIINFTQQNASKAAQLQDLVRKAGVLSVELTQSSINSASSSSVLFSSDITSNIRQKVLSEIQKNGDRFLVQETNNTQLEIIINL